MRSRSLMAVSELSAAPNRLRLHIESELGRMQAWRPYCTDQKAPDHSAQVSALVMNPAQTSFHEIGQDGVGHRAVPTRATPLQIWHRDLPGRTAVGPGS